MHRFTVLLRQTASIVSPVAETTFFVHVTAANPLQAVLAAQEKILTERKIDPEKIAVGGGTDAVLPVMYVLAGHVESLLRGEAVDGPARFTVRKNGRVIRSEIPTWEEAKTHCLNAVREESGNEPVSLDNETRPLPHGEACMGVWQEGPNIWTASEVRSRIVTKW